VFLVSVQTHTLRGLGAGLHSALLLLLGRGMLYSLYLLRISSWFVCVCDGVCVTSICVDMGCVNSHVDFPNPPPYAQV
jgi:hypothetical protein